MNREENVTMYMYLAGADEEHQEGEEEAEVGEAEDEADNEGEEGPAGGEGLPGVAPGHHQDGDDGGGRPPARGEVQPKQQTTIFSPSLKRNSDSSNLSVVHPVKRRHLMMKTVRETVMKNIEPRLNTVLAVIVW